MAKTFKGLLKISENQLNLDLTLLGGQSFRWTKVDAIGEQPQWRGVAYEAFWILTQTADAIKYQVSPAARADKEPSTDCDAEHFRKLLKRYFRCEFDLAKHLQQWKAAHEHFARIASNMKAVRILDQEPFENILSFICSQNNNIKRISTMTQWLCSNYGVKIGTYSGVDEYSYPSLKSLMNDRDLETKLRTAKFGYRAKFIARTVEKINANGGERWFDKLRSLPYEKARLELVTLPGVGFKVADCICLMSLNHLQSVPIDTHIFKCAQMFYMPHLAKVKAVTPKIYDEISAHFQGVYGSYAGWAQAVLFCSSLQQFQTKPNKTENYSPAKKLMKTSG